MNMYGAVLHHCAEYLRIEQYTRGVNVCCLLFRRTRQAAITTELTVRHLCTHLHCSPKSVTEISSAEALQHFRVSSTHQPGVSADLCVSCRKLSLERLLWRSRCSEFCWSCLGFASSFVISSSAAHASAQNCGNQTTEASQNTRPPSVLSGKVASFIMLP